MAWDGGAIVSRLSMDVSGWASSINKAIGSLSGFSGALVAAGAGLAIFAGRYMLQAVSAAQDLEDRIIQLRKVAGTEMGDMLGAGIRELSRELPVASAQMLEVAESAVRLGVTGRSNVLKFVRTMSMVGEVTDMTAIQASESFARLAAVMNVPISEIDKLASAANELSDNMATSFAELVRSAGEMAPILSQMGIAPQEILAIAAAQNEVNVSVQRGAQRLRSFFQQMGQAFREEDIAGALGVTREQFRGLVEDSPVEVFTAIATKMKEGGDAARTLREAFDSAAQLGIQGFSQNLDRFSTALDIAKREMEEGGSLIRQFGEFAKGTTAQQQALTNEMVYFKEEIGLLLLPMKRFAISMISNIIGPINDALDAMRPMREASRYLPEFFAEATKGAVESRQAWVIFGKAFEDLNAIQKMTARSSARGLFVDLAEEVGVYADSLEDAEDRGRLFSHYLNYVIPQLSENRITLQEAGAALDEFAAKLADARVKIDKVGEDADPIDSGGKAKERLAGLNKEFAKSVLAERYGLALSEVSDEQARLLLNLRQAEIAITDGDEAARRFELTLSNWSDTLADVVIGVEGMNEAREKAAQVESAFAEEISELRAYHNALLEGEEAVDRLKLAQQDYSDSMIDEIIAQKKLTAGVIEGREEREKLWRSYKDLEDAMKSELEQVMFSERQLFELRMTTMGLTEAQKERLRWIRETTAAQRAMNEESGRGAEAERAFRERLKERKNAVDLTQLETQYRFLEQGIDRFTDSVISNFDAMAEGSKTFGEAFTGMLVQIQRELMKMALNKALFDLLGSIVGGSSMNMFDSSGFGRMAGSQNSAINLGRGPINDLSQGRATPNFTVNYSINTIDARGVSQMLKEQAPVIANITAKEVRNSTSVKRSMNA